MVWCATVYYRIGVLSVYDVLSVNSVLSCPSLPGYGIHTLKRQQKQKLELWKYSVSTPRSGVEVGFMDSME